MDDLVRRQRQDCPHNPKVVSSNLTPATNLRVQAGHRRPAFFSLGGKVNKTQVQKANPGHPAIAYSCKAPVTIVLLSVSIAKTSVPDPTITRFKLIADIPVGVMVALAVQSELTE